MQDNIIHFTAPAAGAFPDAARLQQHVDHTTTPGQPYPTAPGLEQFITVLDLLNAGRSPLAIAQAMRHHPAHVYRIEGCDYPLAQAAELDDLRNALDWHRALWTACQATGRDFAALPDGADNPLARYGWPESLLPPAFRSPAPLASAPTDQPPPPQPQPSISRTHNATAQIMQITQDLKAQAKDLWLKLPATAREQQGHGWLALQDKMRDEKLPKRGYKTLSKWINEWRGSESTA